MKVEIFKNLINRIKYNMQSTLNKNNSYGLGKIITYYDKMCYLFYLKHFFAKQAILLQKQNK